MSFAYFNDAMLAVIRETEGVDEVPVRVAQTVIALQDRARARASSAFMAAVAAHVYRGEISDEAWKQALMLAGHVHIAPPSTYGELLNVVDCHMAYDEVAQLTDFLVCRAYAEAAVHGETVDPFVDAFTINGVTNTLGYLFKLTFDESWHDPTLDDAAVARDRDDIRMMGLRLLPGRVFGATSDEGVDRLLLQFPQCSDLARKVMRILLDGPGTQEVPADGFDPNDISFLAHVVALQEAEGQDFESACVAAGIDLAWVASTEDESYWDKLGVNPTVLPGYQENAPAAHAFSAYLDVYRTFRGVVESVEHFIFHVRSAIDEWGVWTMPPIIMIMDMLGVVQRELGKLVTQVTGIVLTIMERHAPSERGVRAVIGTALFALADLIDVRHRNNPKSVWALLMTRKGAWVSREEMMLLQLATFSHVASPSYEDWAGDMIRRLALNGQDVSAITNIPPSRAVYYPRNTFGPADNNDLDLAVDVNFHETAREARRVQQALAAGAPRGIDSAWLATATTVQQSIDRYVVPRPTLGPEARLAIRCAADAVFDNCPELYNWPKPMSVASSMAAAEWKFSAGLPFMPAIKSRVQLRNSSWFSAIAAAAEDILESGNVPDVAFHAFPKADVVPRDKVLSDRSAVRTVTAGDRITAIAANTLLLEVNKRVAPLEAFVANQLPRREGGMQEAYSELVKRDCIVTTDGWRFDSQVPKEVMTIGSTRLYERGVEGWWGAKAATTFVEAYYAAVAAGLVVNLVDGYVTRKTGGGGTGSAFTSSDNRNWVRILLVASWSLTTGRPYSEFWDDVTLVNASDDIIFSCGEATAALLTEWQHTLLYTFGLRFDMDRQDSVDGFLHLRVVPENMLDADLYARAGVPMPSHPVRHDPARLATKRSDYRSDRMRHSYLMAADHIATQCFGHILLTAHSPDWYDSVLNEAIEATSEYLGYYYKHVYWHKEFNSKGQLIGADYNVGPDLSPHLVRDRMRRFGSHSSPEATSWTNSRLIIARKWMKCHRYPSYFQVFVSWVTPEDWSKLRPAQKKWTKMVSKVGVSSPAIDLAVIGMLGIAQLTAMVPTGVTRWSGLDIQAVTMPLVTNAFMVEMFVFESFIQNHKTVPSYSEFAAKCREAPYGSITDPSGFWNTRMTQGIDSNYLPEGREARLDWLRARMFVFTLFYAVIDYLQVILRFNRIFGFVIGLFFLLVRDLDKWYAIIHLAYWLSEGEASVLISNLSPRDPFIAQKMFALLLTALVPHGLLRMMSWFTPVARVFKMLAVAAYYGIRTKNAVASAVARGLRDPGSSWGFVVSDILLAAHSDMPVRRVIAPMGTGKSTSFLATLYNTRAWLTLYLVVPTIALVENYSNDFLAPDEVLRVLSDEDWALPHRSLVVITAARFRGVNIAPEVAATALFVFDEVHLCTTDQVVAYFRVRSFQHLAMTGTPLGSLWDAFGGQVRVNEGPARTVKRDIVVVEGGQPIQPNRPESIVAWVSDVLAAHNSSAALYLHPGSRFAVYTPQVGTVSMLQTLLLRSGYEAHVVSANQPTIPRSGVVVGTWSIVTGVNFEPPITAMIDTGLEVCIGGAFNDQGLPSAVAGNAFRNRALAFNLVPSSPANADQVAARAGRIIDGVVFRSPLAATGVDNASYPSVLSLFESGGSGQGPPIHDDVWGILGVESYVVPNVANPAGLLDFLDINRAVPRARVFSPFLKIAMLLACELGSVNEAVGALQRVDAQPREVRQLIVRLTRLYDGLGGVDLSAPPHDLVALMMHVGFRVRDTGALIRVWGRPVVAFRFGADISGHNVLLTRRPRVSTRFILATSGSLDSRHNFVGYDGTYA